MAFDFKKEYKEFYLPKRKPEIIEVPPMNYVAVRGKGDPNEEGGAYKNAIGILYAIAYTIKMSKMGDTRIDGYFDFVVPPLEGFWWQQGVDGVDFSNKETFEWISAIRLPDFVTPEVFAWAQSEAAHKKGLDTSSAELMTIDEGLCAQIMHLGSYDEEPATIALLDDFRCQRRLCARYVEHPRRSASSRDLPFGPASHQARKLQDGHSSSDPQAIDQITSSSE